MSGDIGVPRTPWIGGGLHRGAGSAALAARLRLRALRREAELPIEDAAAGLRMRRLRPSGIGDRGHGLPPHPHTVAQMVPGGVVDGARQARGLGAVSVARVEPALRHRLADGPQAAPCPDGAPGVPAGGLGRGRRELLRRAGQAGEPGARAFQPEQEPVGDGGREVAGRVGQGHQGERLRRRRRAARHPARGHRP